MTATSGTPRAASWASFESEMLPHLDALFRFALWLVRDRPLAEDIVQETLSQALQSYHRYTPGTNARAWLLTILRHVRSKRQRVDFRLPEADDGEAVIEQMAAAETTPQHLTEEEVLAALEQLPAGYQEVVLLSDVEDLSYREIAEVLAIPMGTVMSRLHRARRQLRTTLGGYAARHGIGLRLIRAGKEGPR